MKLKESTVHYLWVFGSIGTFALVALAGWEMAEHSIWFEQYWSHKPSRFLIIFAGTLTTIGLAAYTYSYFWGRKKFIRTYKEINRTELNESRDGELIRIQGELVLLGEPLIAPLSQKECAAYETIAQIEEEVATVSGSETNVGSRTIWQTIKHINKAKDFLIRSEGSYALIRVAQGNLKISLDMIHDEQHYKKDRGGFLTEEENSLRRNTLESMDLPTKPYVGVYSRNIRFQEGVLEQGEQVAVRGTGTWTSTDTDELSFLFGQGVKKVYEIENSEEFQLYFSDSSAVLEK
ncbi:hypothetical protein ACFOEW_07680 [Alteromonas oceani]|uniref:RING-type E3 ubiquitin transferase n=1 Tax=Alteromonas oceani TaxID=2071609 RepID=A0ABV7JUS2_9ALTE|nr:hypothetical protein [Alteromonas oceani]